MASQRVSDGLHGGFWEFPGGKLEAHESPEYALCRELKEELGITVQSCRALMTVAHEYEEFRVRLYFFHVQKYINEPIGREGQQLRWLNMEEGRKLPFLEADLPLLSYVSTLLS